MRALRTAINDFFSRNDVAWEGLMGILVIVWLALGAQPRSDFLTLVMDSITVIFALEFLVRFLATYQHWEYFKSHWIDAVTLLPALRGFRLLRLLRLLRLVRATKGLANQISVLEYIAGDLTIRTLFLIWFTVTLLASLLFYFAEAGDNPAVGGPTDAIWWALVTATTVGYGDIYPMTPAGRAAGVVMMLVGIATFSALAGLIGSALQRRRADIAAGLTADDMAAAEDAGTTTDDPAFRLRRLTTLRDEGLISGEEYETRRAAVVADL